MIFWIILGIFILCAFYTWITGPCDDFGDFRYRFYISFVLGVILLCSLIPIAGARICASKTRAKNLQKYQMLMYKAEQYNKLQNKFDFSKESIINDIYKYNTDLAIYQANVNNIWIGIFYGKDLYRDCDYIDLDTLNID